MFNNISFKKFDENDLFLMHKWLNSDYVTQWYGKKNYTMDEVKVKYIPYINHEEPIYSFIILYDKQPIGYIQTYKIKDYPDYAQKVGLDEDASGLDLFIGDYDYLHKGLGKYIISKFLIDKVFNNTNTTCCVLGPEPKNIVAIKTYEKVGFKYIKTIQVEEDEPEYLMKIYFDEIKIK